MKRIAKQILRLACTILARDYEKKIVGPHIRVRWNSNELFLEELPEKGKRHLRKYNMYILPWAEDLARGVFNFHNIIDDAHVQKNDTYDEARKGLDTAQDELAKQVESDVGKNPMKGSGRYEDQVHYLKVEPEDSKPFTAKGKDFAVSVKWTNFSAYSPDSDFNQSDPYYTEYAASAPASARKLYKILKADPQALRNVSWDRLGDWLEKNKVRYEINHSVWR